MEDKEKFRKELEDKCRKTAEKRGEEFIVITKEIPFINDDVPKYLQYLACLEAQSQKSEIIVGSYRKVA